MFLSSLCPVLSPSRPASISHWQFERHRTSQPTSLTRDPAANVPEYTLEAANTSVITETDNNRIICIWLSCKLTAVEWARAAEKYGSINTDSFKIKTKRLLKKIKAASSNTPETTTSITDNAKITEHKPNTAHKKRKIEDGPDSDDSGLNSGE